MVLKLCYLQTNFFHSIDEYSGLHYVTFTADRFPVSVHAAVRFGSCWSYGSDLLRFMSVRFVWFDSVRRDTESW